SGRSPDLPMNADPPYRHHASRFQTRMRGAWYWHARGVSHRRSHTDLGGHRSTKRQDANLCSVDVVHAGQEWLLSDRRRGRWAYLAESLSFGVPTQSLIRDA